MAPDRPVRRRIGAPHESQASSHCLRASPSNQNGQTWAVLITDNGQTVFDGEKVTRGRSGSFEARARTANQPGTDNFVATAQNAASGETCTGELTFTR